MNNLDADELALRLVLRHARKDATSTHLRECEGLTVEDPEAVNGMYGCDTGCEYARLSARLNCPHGETEDYYYGEFGYIGDLVDEMLRDAKDSAP